MNSELHSMQAGMQFHKSTILARNEYFHKS